MRGGVKHQTGLTPRRLTASQLASHVSPAEREQAACGGPCPVRGCEVITSTPNTHAGQVVSWHATDPPDRDAMVAPPRGGVGFPSHRR